MDFAGVGVEEQREVDGHEYLAESANEPRNAKQIVLLKHGHQAECRAVDDHAQAYYLLILNIIKHLRRTNRSNNKSKEY